MTPLLDQSSHVRRRLMRSYELEASTKKYALGHEPLDFATRARLWMRTSIEWQFLRHYPATPPKWRMLLRGFGGERVLPDFAIVGPIKGGSSDLAVSIMSHPQVMVPISKEIHSADPHQWRNFYPTERERAIHSSIHGIAKTPFLSPWLHWMELAYRYSKARPEAKIVLTLRNPVRRVYSHWKWEVFLAGKRTSDDLPFLKDFDSYVAHALDIFPMLPMYTACGFACLETSIYWKAVEYWINCFGRENVLVLNIDDYFRHRNPTLSRIVEFVGLNTYDFPIWHDRVNDNPLQLPPPSDDTLLKLKAFFRPYNENLWELVGETFDW